MKSMRTYLIAASVAATLATPALAAENGAYVGVEGGAIFPQKSKLDVTLNNKTRFDKGYDVKDKTGYDADIIAGYKFGLLRLEGELGYKRTKLKNVKVSQPLLTAVGAAAGAPVTSDKFNLDGHVSIASLMVNALADTNFGGSRFGGYIGAGVGEAWANTAGSNDNTLAVQGIAGLRYAVSDHIDAGIKYRYFYTGKLSLDSDFVANNVPFSTHSAGRFKSSSVLASLAYNFGSRAPQVAEQTTTILATPEAPPPPPASQTCPDGSTVAATAICSAPPAPPPPPPAVRSGERG
jgi:opacity protein-like surface antigen